MTVDETGVEETGVDKTVVDETGADELCINPIFSLYSQVLHGQTHI